MLKPQEIQVFEGEELEPIFEKIYALCTLNFLKIVSLSHNLVDETKFVVIVVFEEV